MRLIIIIVAIMATDELFAQNDTIWYRVCNGCSNDRTANDPSGIRYTYNAKQAFITQDIISDYVIRNTNGTWFHQAIDYTVVDSVDTDYGDAILAINGGTITEIRGSGYKYITVGNYRYGHIFRSGSGNNKVGKFYKKKLIAKNLLLKICQ